MITKFLIFFAGAMIGLITMALAAVAGDAERCEDCLRMREELMLEEELERIKEQILDDNSVLEPEED